LDGQLVQERIRPFGTGTGKTEAGVTPEMLFDDLVNQVPPGSMGLMLQPYWSPGVKVPGPEAKEAIIGFGDVHTRAHIYRSILERLAYALREGKERTERRSKIPITELRVSGVDPRATRPCRSPPTSLGCPPSGLTFTKHRRRRRPGIARRF